MMLAEGKLTEDQLQQFKKSRAGVPLDSPHFSRINQENELLTEKIVTRFCEVYEVDRSLQVSTIAREKVHYDKNSGKYSKKAGSSKESCKGGQKRKVESVDIRSLYTQNQATKSSKVETTFIDGLAEDFL